MADVEDLNDGTETHRDEGESSAQNVTSRIDNDGNAYDSPDSLSLSLQFGNFDTDQNTGNETSSATTPRADPETDGEGRREVRSPAAEEAEPEGTTAMVNGGNIARQLAEMLSEKRRQFEEWSSQQVLEQVAKLTERIGVLEGNFSDHRMDHRKMSRLVDSALAVQNSLMSLQQRVPNQNELNIINSMKAPSITEHSRESREPSAQMQNMERKLDEVVAIVKQLQKKINWIEGVQQKHRGVPEKVDDLAKRVEILEQRANESDIAHSQRHHSEKRNEERHDKHDKRIGSVGKELQHCNCRVDKVEEKVDDIGKKVDGNIAVDTYQAHPPPQGAEVVAADADGDKVEVEDSQAEFEWQ